MWHFCMLREFTTLVSYNIFFLEFFELFFNGEIWRGMRWFSWIFRIIFQWGNVTWRDMRWCGMLLKFLELFLNREMWCGMRWFFFNSLNYFSIEKGDMTWSLNFQNYSSTEKGEVAWGNFLEFLELFFNGIRWCGTLLKFLEIFFNGEIWHGMRLCDILARWENWK
jgi:hypothetical protein